jgi:hypothetical protein
MIPIHELARAAGKQLNRTLQAAGVQIVRSGPRPFEEFRDYIPFKGTLLAAQAEGISVSDYIDRHYNVPGATQDTIDRLAAAGVLTHGVRRVGEIGPGSGRYLERTIALCRPVHVEIYETAVEWRDYLIAQHGVVGRPTDGSSLAATPASSLDLVQAHKVFVGLPLVATFRYLREMARVVVPGGYVVFDMMTEPCMTEEVVDRWLSSSAAYSYYPSMIPRQYLIDFFTRRGFDLTTAFVVPNTPGKTECFAFARRRDQTDQK